MILVSIFAFILYLAMIIVYFHMNERLKEISANTMNTKKYVKLLTEQNAELHQQLFAIHSAQVAGRKQYFYDHCFADNMQPHEWKISNQNYYVIEFTCQKCGQRIMIPRHLDAGQSVMIQPVAKQSEK